MMFFEELVFSIRFLTSPSLQAINSGVFSTFQDFQIGEARNVKCVVKSRQMGEGSMEYDRRCL